MFSDPWGFFILNPFTNVLLLIYNLIGHNFGLAVILFTILIRAITWPLNAQQLKGAKVMQELQSDKEWLDIQKKYAKDREKLAQEQMRIYQERGINPLASCLPTLIQFPIIIGLYQSVTRALAATPLTLLQLARSIYPMVISASALIPLNSHFLWMDLGRPEGLPFPGGFTISFLPYGFPTLAIIVALTTYLQTKLTLPPSSNPNDQAAAMNGMMTIYMPLFLGWLVLNYASGLAVYFVTSNVLGIIQYSMMGRVNWRNLLPGGSKPAPSNTKKNK
ncbi:MAG: YidC/Oxa1 family membrane protein insertase [Anaerolineales bacterium]